MAPPDHLFSRPAESQVSQPRYANPDLIQRCERFWNREPTDRPLVGVLVNRMHPLKHFSTGKDSPEVLPEDIAVDAFLAECDRRHAASEATGGDAVFVAYPTAGIPWLSAIMGCAVRFSGTSAWTEKYPGDWKTYDADRVAWDNGWFDKMNELTRAAVDHAAERYPVGPCHLHGVIDVAAAMIGSEQLCLAIYEYPAELGRLLDVIANVWSRVAETHFEFLPSYDGGYFNGNQPLWAPGKTMFVPADAVSLLSPAVVERWVVPRVRRTVVGLDYSIAHTHSSYLHGLDAFLEIDELRAVQVGMDTAGPSIAELLPTLQNIQRRKALIVAIVVEDPRQAAEDAKTAVRTLVPEGLCVLSYLPTPEAGREFMAYLNK